MNVKDFSLVDLNRNDIWSFTPLLFVAAFSILFVFYAARLELRSPFWSKVKAELNSGKNTLPIQPGQAQHAGSAKDLNSQGVLATGQAAKQDGANTSAPAEGKRSASSESKEPTLLTKELSFRIFLGTAQLLFAFLCLLVICQSLRSMQNVCALRWFWIVGLAGIAVVVFWCSNGFENSTEVPTISGGEACQELLQQIKQGSTSSGAVFVPMQHIGLLTKTLSAASRVGLLITALAASFVLCALRKNRQKLTSDGGLKEGVTGIKNRYEELLVSTNSLLQLTAAALVVGVFEVYFLYTMASFRVESILRTDVQHFALIMAIATSIVYSGLLTAIFLPVYDGQRTLERELVRRRAGSAGSEQTQTSAGEDSKDALSSVPFLKSAFAVLSPVLAALATMLATVLKDILPHP